MDQTRQLFIIGGPNGAGKTTTAFTLMPELIQCSEYINADAIAKSLSPFNPDSVAIKAGKIMLNRIKELVSLKQNFAFETTMASRNFVNLIQECKALNFQINIIYIWVTSPELAVERVKHRVLSGGHSIPEDVIKRRYTRSMTNFQQLYQPIADRWMLCDNSNDTPFVIAHKRKRSTETEIYNQEYWQIFNERKL